MKITNEELEEYVQAHISEGKDWVKTFSLAAKDERAEIVHLMTRSPGIKLICSKMAAITMLVGPSQGVAEATFIEGFLLAKRLYESKSLEDLIK